jgi:ribose transport system permease protein
MKKSSELIRNERSIMDLVKKYNLLLLLVLFIAISTSISPNFLQLNNFNNLMQSASFGGIIAIGMTFVILIGGIDLSVGMTANFAGMVCAYLLVNGIPVFLSIIIAVLGGSFLGLISGIVITYFRLPPFIGTMSVMTIAQGLALFITNGKVVNKLPNAFKTIGSSRVIGGFPLLGLIWIIITVIAALILKFTPFGRRIYAIGGNKEAAFLSGIKIRLYSILCYVISGSLSALTGVLLASYLTVGQPTAMQAGELSAIAAVAIGGTSMNGGVGGVIGTFGGVVLLQIITNIFNLIGMPPYFHYIFQGVIIILALVLNSFVVKKSDE